MAIEASPYGGLTDEELLVLSRTRPDAFGTFYERHAEPLLAFFARRTFDPEIAAELTAETFAQAFAGRRRFEKRGAAGAAWLYAIGRHQLGRFYRTGWVEAAARKRIGLPPRELSEVDYERIEELLDFKRLRGAIRQSFARLPEAQREALTLRVVEKRPYAEVARVLSCTEQVARARVSRGLRRLRGLLENQVREPTHEETMA